VADDLGDMAMGTDEHVSATIDPIVYDEDESLDVPIEYDGRHCINTCAYTNFADDTSARNFISPPPPVDECTQPFADVLDADLQLSDEDEENVDQQRAAIDDHDDSSSTSDHAEHLEMGGRPLGASEQGAEEAQVDDDDMWSDAGVDGGGTSEHSAGVSALERSGQLAADLALSDSDDESEAKRPRLDHFSGAGSKF
jgi:hypothetical protein